MAIKLPADTQKKLLLSIQRFLSEQYDLSVGDVNAGIVLDFCLKEIGPSIYNQAVAEAQGILQDRVAELENVCFEDEFGYWPSPARKSVARKPSR